jgi:hypothetical protein
MYMTIAPCFFFPAGGGFVRGGMGTDGREGGDFEAIGRERGDERWDRRSIRQKGHILGGKGNGNELLD